MSRTNRQDKRSSWSLQNWLERPVSSLPLAIWRILFGAVMFLSTLRFMLKGWINEFYVLPTFHFTYLWFGWVKPLSETGMYSVFALMLIATLFITLGLFYRISSISFFLLFTYVELIDKTYYLNHYYFVTLVSFLTIFLPLNKRFSLDTQLGITQTNFTVPNWTVNALKLQLIIVYVFAGIAKLNPDWLLAAQPLRIWLRAKTDLPLIGTLFNYPWVAYAMSWAGMIYDLSIPFLLLWRKTRLSAYLIVIAFHTLTAILFPIGMFPWIMLTTTLIFFSEKDLKRLGAWRSEHRQTPNVAPNNHKTNQANHLKRKQLNRSILCLFFLFQLSLNLRHYAYPSNVLWTEEGFRFSWRVMLTEKTGLSIFSVKDKQTGQSYTVFPSDYLNAQQVKQMSYQPDMILQFAHHLKDDFSSKGYENTSVFVEAHVSLNGRRSQLLIDPKQDLANIPYDLKHKKWIMPLAN